MTFDLISDISALTTLPDATLRKLCDKSIECICHGVLESDLKNDGETFVNTPIGSIKIIVTRDEIHYRFIPSSKLENMLIDALSSGTDPLVTKIEDGLVARILNTYKDLI